MSIYRTSVKAYFHLSTFKHRAQEDRAVIGFVKEKAESWKDEELLGHIDAVMTRLAGEYRTLGGEASTSHAESSSKAKRRREKTLLSSTSLTA